VLKTDWKDDKLSSSMNGQRQYIEIENSNGTVSFSDVSEYDQVGDEFGAKELNELGAEINQMYTDTQQASDMAQASAESARQSAENAMASTPEGYQNFVNSTNEHLSTLDGKMQNFNTYENYTVVDSVSNNHITRLQVASDSHQSYLFNHEEGTDDWFGETLSTYLNAPTGVDILTYICDTSIFSEGTRKLVRGYNSVNSPLNNDDNDFYYDVIKGPVAWFKVIAYDVRSTNIYINEKINNVWQGWKPIRCDMIQGTLSAGATSVTITDSRITTDATYDIYASKFGISPTAVTVNNGSMILTFDKQTEPITVGVKIV
jgi:hypothetical protein